MFNTQKYLDVYNNEDLYSRKKVEYLLKFLKLIVLYSIFVLLINFFNFGYSIIETMKLFIWLTIVALIINLIKQKKLEFAVNIFTIGGIGKAIDLMNAPIAMHFYVHASLIIFIAAAIHVKKYQLYSVFVISYALLVYQAFLPVDSFFYQTAILITSYRISIVIGVFMYILSIRYLSSIIDREIIKAKQLRYISRIDTLTGLNNRLCFNEYLELMNEENSYYFMILDLDHFKKVNDIYGHDIGDKVLRKFGQLLNNTVNKEGEVFRLGGEEFGIFLPNYNINKGLRLANKILNITRETDFDLKTPLTVSMGTIFINANNLKEELKHFYKKADESLYSAKCNGRNQIVQTI